MTSIEIINNLTQETIIKKPAIDKLFKYIKNPAKGNCFFESLSQIFNNGNLNRHLNMRQDICDFYKIFDETADYPHNSIQQYLSYSLIADPYDDDGELHKTNICEANTWANLSDIYASSILYSRNIILFYLLESNKEYRIVPVLNPDSREYIYIRHVHGEHYEAMMLKNNDSVNVQSNHHNPASKSSPPYSSTQKKQGRPPSPKSSPPHSATQKKRGRPPSPKSPPPHSATQKKRGRPPLTKKNSPPKSPKKHSSPISPSLLLKSLKNTLYYDNNLSESQIKDINNKIDVLEKNKK